MSDLSTRLKYAQARLFGTATETIPVPFELKCSCGESVSGLRKSSWQQVVCRACQEPHFVLPVNIYPSSRRVPSLVLEGGLLQRLKVVLIEFFATDTPEVEIEEASRKSAAVTALKDYAPPPRVAEQIDVAGADPTEATTSTDRVVAEATPSVPKLRTTVGRRRIITPFRMLLVGAMLVAIGTGWWITHQKRLEVARNLWRSSMDSVGEAIEAGDLQQLTEHLQSAVDAAAILQRRDSDVLAAENLLRQSIAVSRLSSLDLLFEVEQLAATDDSERSTAVRSLQRLVAGEWFLFECGLRASRERGDHVELLLPSVDPRVNVRFLIRSQWLSDAQAEAPDTLLVLAARVDRLVWKGGAGPSVEIQLDPESATLMTSPRHCEQAGFADGTDSFLGLLDRQEEFVRQHDRMVPPPETADEEPAT